MSEKAANEERIYVLKKGYCKVKLVMVMLTYLVSTYVCPVMTVMWSASVNENVL